MEEELECALFDRSGRKIISTDEAGLLYSHAIEVTGYIVLDSPQAGGPLRYFKYPYAEADGKAMGEDCSDSTSATK